MDEGHYVFGVDIRPNPWTDRIPTLLRDRAPYPSFDSGIGYVQYPLIWMWSCIWRRMPRFTNWSGPGALANHHGVQCIGILPAQ
jgi:hypothetical protein